MRYATFIWDADGDMGDAVALVATTVSRAEARADAVRTHAARYGPLSIEAMVIPVLDPTTSLERLFDKVVGS